MLPFNSMTLDELINAIPQDASPWALALCSKIASALTEAIEAIEDLPEGSCARKDLIGILNAIDDTLKTRGES